MFTIKIKNTDDWSYYEAVDFVIIIPPEQPVIEYGEMVWTDRDGGIRKVPIDDYVPEDLNPPNAKIKIFALRQKDDQVVNVAFSQDAYVINDLGKTVDKH